MRTSIEMLLLTVISSASILLPIGCSDGDEKTDAFNSDASTLTTRTKDPISKEAVDALVIRKLGESSAAGEPVIRSITLTPEADGVYVNLELNRTASCHAGALVGTAVSMSQQIMSALFRYPDVSRIQLSLYGTTDDTADKDKLAVRIMVTKESASKIDWFQFKDTTVSALATELWVEPAVYANWQKYGAAPIADEATRAAANNGVTTLAPDATSAAP